MPCGSCGGRKQANTEYLVTFRDGSTKRVATVQEARIERAKDTTSDPTGRNKTVSIQAVPKAKTL